MSDFLELKFDVKEIMEVFQGLEKQAKSLLRAAAADLAAKTQNKVQELAQSQLHSRRGIYLDNLGYSQVNEDTWVVYLQAPAMWIEEGRQAGEMIDDLLKNATKTNKQGQKYRSIPFKQNKLPQNTPKGATDLMQAVKSELKRQKISYGKIEKNSDGSPKLGLLHKLDIMNAPKKTHNGTFQGQGPIGAVKQGHTGIPYLQGIRIYQNMEKVKNKLTGKMEDKVQRHIFTFRTVSESQKGSGKWVYPGIQPVKFLDQAFEWAKQEFENRIKPDIIKTLNES